MAVTITTNRASHQYDILVRPGIFADWPDETANRVPATRYIAMADENVAALYGIEARLAGRKDWSFLPVTPGETRKNLEQYRELCEKALALGIDRKTVIVSVGGGVTGDIAGYVAATLLRGIRFVQVPTTLLAQVDSSVGGKTGVNAAAGKNLVGAFHQPEAVLIDPAVLDTLPEREYLAGLAEVVKYGVIGDRAFFDKLTAASARLKNRDSALLTEIIEHCCRMKAEIVADDEREKGRRALLNLGHTFGHALEALAGYDGGVVHGEAVAAGMALAAAYAAETGVLHKDEAERIRSALALLDLPRHIAQLGGSGTPPDWAALLASDRLAAALSKDKKAEANRLSLILPYAIGDSRKVDGVDPDAVADFMHRQFLTAFY